MKLDGKREWAAIKARIDALGWTWNELCRRSKVDRATVLRWGNGTSPRKRTWSKVMRAIMRGERRAAE